MNSVLHPIRRYRRRKWRKKVMSLPWALWSMLNLYAGDSTYYSSGCATDDEYVQALKVIGSMAEQVDTLLKKWGYLP